MHRSQYSSVDVETKLDDRETVVRFPAVAKNLSSPLRPDRLWGPTLPPIQLARGKAARGVGREADRSTSFMTEVKNEWSYTSTPVHICSWRGV
jgi:hypothetical protein